MSEVTLKRLRELRDRATALQENVLADLEPFVKNEDGTFRRKPDSPTLVGDVNVTTTCSCLMALALTKQFAKFYGLSKPDIEKKSTAVFARIANAPWMSSGLTANNAFTTTLVLRTLGFLIEEELVGDAKNDAASIINKKSKPWELRLGIKDILRFAKRLSDQSSPAAQFFWLSLSDKTRALVQTAVQSNSGGETTVSKEALSSAVTFDIQKSLQSGWIYDAPRFDKASQGTKETLEKNPTGYLLTAANHRLLADQFSEDFEKPELHSMVDIATRIGTSPSNFSINEYPASAALVYWFVDGIDRGRIQLPTEDWNKLCAWAAKQFNHERSLVVAKHDAMMDPVAMGMCACLCARLRSISEKALHGAAKGHLALLPSVIELEQAIRELLLYQTDSGIFPKYFPLFHYQDAGSNFCFTFELLEAVLHEFGGCDGSLVSTDAFIGGLEKGVGWCENNRLKYPGSPQPYAGWNSGGYLDSLMKEQPESWATAVVHMFLWEVRDVLSQRIQKEILQKYKARPPQTRVPGDKSSAMDELLDVEVLLQKKAQSVLMILKERIIEKYACRTQDNVRHSPIKDARSALLFGPPGTSKTEIVRAVADDLEWPMVDLTPSEFVRGTLANIYLQAEEIFEDMMDLSAVVVFFDEMDALVQTREGEAHLDIASQFLTTTMLPKLTRLHDKGTVVFFMATNFQERFDAAIKRSGRFDLLLCMGPPKLDEKLEKVHRVFGLEDSTGQTRKAGATIRAYLKDDSTLLQQLGLYTFGEYRAFLKTFGKEDQIGDNLVAVGKNEFIERLKGYNETLTLKLSDLEPLKQIGCNWTTVDDLDKQQFSLKQLEEKKLQPTQIIRYYCTEKSRRNSNVRSIDSRGLILWVRDP